MPLRFWRKLAGCCVIEFACAVAFAAHPADWKAGVATVGQVTALAFEDGVGTRAVVVATGSRLDFDRSELLAARAMRDYGFDRGAVLLRGAATGPPESPEEVLQAIGAAVAALSPARLHWAAGSLWVGRAIAQINPDGVVVPGAKMPAGAVEVFGPIRSVFQLVDLSDGLKRREDAARAAPLQVLAFGKQAAILALPGDAHAEEFRADRLIVAPFSNSSSPAPDDPRYRDAVRRAMARVGR